MDDDASALVQQAQRIVYQASWRLQEEAVLERLAGTSGLCWAPLEPRSDVIQLVTYDGEHLGYIRQDSGSGPDDKWVAVPGTLGRLTGSLPDCPGRRPSASRSSRQDAAGRW